MRKEAITGCDEEYAELHGLRMRIDQALLAREAESGKTRLREHSRILLAGFDAAANSRRELAIFSGTRNDLEFAQIMDEYDLATQSFMDSFIKTSTVDGVIKNVGHRGQKIGREDVLRGTLVELSDAEFTKRLTELDTHWNAIIDDYLRIQLSPILSLLARELKTVFFNITQDNGRRVE